MIPVFIAIGIFVMSADWTAAAFRSLSNPAVQTDRFPSLPTAVTVLSD